MSRRNQCNEIRDRIEDLKKRFNELITFYEEKYDQVIPAGDELESLIQNLKMSLGRLRYAEAFVNKGCVNYDKLKNAERGITHVVDILSSKKEGVVAADVVQNLEEILGWIEGIIIEQPLPQPSPSPIPPSPPGQVYIRLLLEETGEWTDVKPPFVIGRYDPPSGPSRLAVREYLSSQQGFGNVIYVFNSTFSKHGCIEGEIDCTSRNHVKVFHTEEGIVVEHCGNPEVTRTYVISGGKQLTLKSGDRYELGVEGVIRLSGAYIERTKTPATLRLVLSSAPAGWSGELQDRSGSYRFTKPPK